MKIITLIVFSVSLIAFSSCTNDNEEDFYGKNECGDAVSFANDIQPVIQANCAISTCHTAGNQPPAFTSYQNIRNSANGIKTMTSNRTMPPPGSGITLSAEQIKTIACWVDSGAPNN